MNSNVKRSRGRYRYLRNGEDTGIEENWLLSERGQYRDISSQRVAPAAGITIGVESRQRDFQFEHCTIQWQRHHQKLDQQLHQHLTADYAFSGNTLRVTRTGNLKLGSPGSVYDDGVSEDTHESTLDGVFSPLMRIFNGTVIQQLLDAGGSSEVVVPWIRDQQQHRRLLLPDRSLRQAETMAEELLSIDGTDHRCRKFHYSGGEYSADTPFWLDPLGVMLMYQWQQDENNLWEVKLQDYQPLS